MTAPKFDQYIKAKELVEKHNYSVLMAVNDVGINDATYYRWRKRLEKQRFWWCFWR